MVLVGELRVQPGRARRRRDPHAVLRGQTSVDENGAPQHVGDMAGQIALAADNLDAVLRAADMTYANLVRLNFYTTDVGSYLANAGVLGERLGAAGVAPAGTLLGVATLAFPELLIEIEATAVS